LGFAINAKCDPGAGTAPLLVPDPLCPPLCAQGHQWVREFAAASYLRTMKHCLAKPRAVSRTEFGGWISAPGTAPVPGGEPRAWPDLGPVLA